jgi:hypothetical protein
VQKAISPLEAWSDRISAFPRNNRLAAARAHSEAARSALAEAEAALRAHFEPLIARGAIFDSSSQDYENRLIAAKVAMREALAAEREAQEAGAPNIERHIERHQAEGFEMLRAKLREVQEIAKVLAAVAARATAEGANPNLKLSKARRLHADGKAMLARISR